MFEPLDRSAPPDGAGPDDLVERLLKLMSDELGAVVTLDVFDAPDAEALQPSDVVLTVAAVGQDGVTYGRLLVMPIEGAGTAVDEIALGEVVARLIGERLEREARERASWDARVFKIREVLDRQALVMRYQPIVALRDGAIQGVEALATFPGREELSPDRWFADANGVGLGIMLEVAAVELALEAMPLLPPGAFLSVNVSPETAVSDELHALLSSVPLEQLVFEITEHAEVTDYEALNAVLRPLRAAGLRLAVDDAGAGFASLRHILQMAPDLIKLDRTLVAGIDSNPVLRALTYSIASFASATEAVVVAEGIETPGELNALRFLGIECGQGYHLRRPGPLAEVLGPEADTAMDIADISRSSAG